jgi:SAM-dependent methyltransferase
VSLNRLEETYRRHHAESRAPSFVFAGPERSAAFREWVGTGKRVLDLGCRYGALTRAYLQGNEVVGVDVDREALTEAQRLGIETVAADVEQPLPFPDAGFDVVVAGELIEHLRFPEKVVAEVQRVLRPGGLLLGSTPNAYRLKNRLIFLAGRTPDFAGDPTHLRFYGEGNLRRLLAPFDDVEIRWAAGRFTRLHPRLFGNVMLFRARKPPS